MEAAMRTTADLERLIKEHGYNLLTFSEHIEVPQTTIYSLFRRNKNLENTAYRVYRAIANGLGMTSDELDSWMNDDR
jgi:predicted transcriptional regulator